MKTSKAGIDIIKKFEGCKLKAYLCPAKVWTIGWGNTYYENKVKVKEGDVITQDRADKLLLNLLTKYEDIVKANIKVQLTQNKFDAMVSFVYNTGGSYTLYKMINNKAKDSEIVKWMETHYITGGGQKLAGLVKRRKAEAELFATP